METIASRIEKAAKGDKSITFVSGDHPLTKSWAELHEDAKAMAARLQQIGVSPGDHVALLGPTTPDFVTAVQAVWLSGATLVILPLPMRLASIEEFASETRTRIALADSSLVVVDSDLAPFVEPTPDDPPMCTLTDLVETSPGAAAYLAPDVDPEALAVLQFTSGSTSEPKGVMLPNKVLAANLDAILEAADVNVETDVMVSWLPLYHDMGLVGFLTLPMTAGIDLVLGAPQDFLASPGRWMEWISTYGGTATAGPNFSYVLATRALRRSGTDLDLSKLRIALNGAEPVDPAAVREFAEAGARHGMRPEAIFPAFGMAEVAIAGSFPTPMSGLQTDVVDAEVLEHEHRAVTVAADDARARELVILGRPVPGLEFRIVDPSSGAEVDERGVGELQIRGTSVTSGYYRRPDANADLFDGEWLRTGDLAYLTDGQMVMCGRIKDVIIIGGRNIYPQDIERAVGELDDIRSGNVIAFSVPGRHGKEAIAVVAETKSDQPAELEHEVVSAVVAAVGVPCRDVVLVEPGSLPKTSSGKLQRALCKRRYADQELRRVDAD